MNMLVLSKCSELVVTCTKNDMTKCDGAKAKRTRKRSKEAPRPAAMKLCDPGHHPHSAAKPKH